MNTIQYFNSSTETSSQSSIQLLFRKFISSTTFQMTGNKNQCYQLNRPENSNWPVSNKCHFYPAMALCFHFGNLISKIMENATTEDHWRASTTESNERSSSCLYCHLWSTPAKRIELLNGTSCLTNALISHSFSPDLTAKLNVTHQSRSAISYHNMPTNFIPPKRC